MREPYRLVESDMETLTKVIYGDDTVVYYGDPNDIRVDHPDGIERITHGVLPEDVPPEAEIY